LWQAAGPCRVFSKVYHQRRQPAEPDAGGEAYRLEALMIVFRPAAKQPSPLPAVVDHGALTGVSRNLYRFQTGREWAKNFRWFIARPP
jgi:hypothetical protein